MRCSAVADSHQASLLHSQVAYSTTRRQFLRDAMYGVGGLGLASILGDDAQAGGLDFQRPHFTPKARRVIYLHMAGSPPQQDLFDHKPELRKWDRKPCPDSILEGERFAFIKGHPKLLASPHQFAQVGPQGTWMSSLLPGLSQEAGELCIVRSMYTDQFNHAPAQLLMFTGSPRLGRPSMGAWATYGLGSENADLPGYVVLLSGANAPSAGKSAWGSGFLPSIHQGVQCQTSGPPVLHAADPVGVDRMLRRESLDALAELNQLAHHGHQDPETLARIEQYELAFRMQMAAPEATDLAEEPEWVREDYGADPGADGSFANNCLLARRLVERGTRFVHLFDWGWDFHGEAEHTDIEKALPGKARMMDKAVSALLRDLRSRGLLDDTLVVWSGEFGRTSMNEERDGSKFLGRDHHPHCFTIWMAGGGVKAGLDYGATDPFGYRVEQNPVHVHDLQATILHLLGFDHEQLTFPYQGRNHRLTDVHGKVVRSLLAEA